MRSATDLVMNGGLEQRSGLPGLGSRPARHPSWDERQQDGMMTAVAPIRSAPRDKNATPSVDPAAILA